MRDFFSFAESLISGMLPFVFLIIAGIYYTVKTDFFQFRYLPRSIKYALVGIFKKKGGDGVSPFQAACTALSATVGTGNIAGVAGALSLGGAGAIFWMWISAFAGMIIKVAEIVLSLDYREKQGNSFIGGPMYYIKNGLPSAFKPLASVFAFSGIFAVFSSGNITQTNAAVASVGGSFPIRLAGGIAFAVITFAIITGGAARIGLFTEKIVPLMAALYIVMSSFIIIKNITVLPIVFKMIFEGAFRPSAVTGGVIGSFTAALVNGASKGVFSNEAGLGTSAMAHAASQHTDGVKQGLYGIFEVFTDTVVICTLTALTVLCSGTYIEYGKTASTELVKESLLSTFGHGSGVLLAVMMCLFGISSVIGWGYYGTVCCEYIFKKPGKKLFILIYPLICVFGALCNADTAWRLSSFFNGIMLCVNTFAVILLSGKAVPSLNSMKNQV